MRYNGNRYSVIPKHQNRCRNKLPLSVKSSLERKFIEILDLSDNVVMWKYEPFVIPYYSIVTRCKCNYIPDFIVKVRDDDGNYQHYLIEIKPSAFAKPPRRTKNKSRKQHMQEYLEYLKNVSKWEAAKQFCTRTTPPLKFRVVTKSMMSNNFF